MDKLDVLIRLAHQQLDARQNLVEQMRPMHKAGCATHKALDLELVAIEKDRALLAELNA